VEYLRVGFSLEFGLGLKGSAQEVGVVDGKIQGSGRVA